MARKPRTRAEGFTSGNLNTLVGSTFIGKLTDKTNAPLRIGQQAWSTHELAMRIGVVNTKAARLLSDAARSIGATSVRDLYRNSTPYTFALHGIGETTLYVLWRLFEAEGLDPDRWATAGDTKAALVSFHSLKARERKAEERTKKAARRQQRTNSRTAEQPPEGVTAT
jgi:hypothetical protein